MDLKNVPVSTNFEDRTKGGLEGFLQGVRAALDMGEFSKEFAKEQVESQAELDRIRRKPLHDKVFEQWLIEMNADPTNPDFQDVDIDATVDALIRRADVVKQQTRDALHRGAGDTKKK